MPHSSTPTSISTRSVAILTGPSTHLDHLGVLSGLLKIPLIVIDEKTSVLAKRYYPQIDHSLIEMSDLSMEFLASHFDAIFETGKFWALELKPFLKLLFQKSMRFVYCPHGNSDKGHSLKEHPEQDLSLIYGDHLHDHLDKTGALAQINKVVATGNYRYPFYRQHKTFYDNIADEEVFSRFPKGKKILLYAPTWQDRENPTAFFQATDNLIAELSPFYHLLIKLHPFLVEDHLPQLIYLQHRHAENRSVYFLDEFPPIYPLLNRCDLYLGDYSSIGYDFLAFDRPLYFFNSQAPSSVTPYTSLAPCGIAIPPSALGKLKAFLDDTLSSNQADFSSKRRQLYSYAFGEEKSEEALRQDIFGALYSD
jgi:hypothetical protein